MSQYHEQYGDYDSPTSSRQPRPSLSIDENGFHQFPPQSSSSIYDDPEEMETMRELDGEAQDGRLMEVDNGAEETEYAVTPLSSPTPSSSGGHSSFFHQRQASSYSSNTSQYSRPHSFFSEPPPPGPNFSRPRNSNVFSSRSTSSFPPPTQSRSAAQHSSSQIIRPNPIRPMPINRAVASKPAPPPQKSFSQPRSSYPSSTSSYPIPANGNTSRRRDIGVRPDAETVGARWQRGTMNGNENRIVEMNEGDNEEEEAQYWRDDGFDQAVMQIDTSSQRAQPHPRADRAPPPSNQSQEPPVQYYEDLVPRDSSMPGARAFAQTGPPANRVRKQGIKLVAVSRLPDAFRSIWRFPVFNAVQSYCFDSVYGSDENVVVSAPTGAGKTVLFELAIIRILMNSDSKQSKVLYMAPTKSLCSERANDWKRKFDSGLGWKVVELTGDSDIGGTVWREVASSRIIVTTPEKWDAMTRRWHDHSRILSELQLFCVDEVHSVGTDVRGAVLEVVVSRMKTLGTSTRFLAVSATVPNIQDVAGWLRNASNEEPAKVFEFGDEFRPCPLQKIVYGYNKSNNDFAFTKTLNTELFKLVKKHSSGKPVLIFCSTRKGCSEAAEQLVKDYKESLAGSQSNRQSLAWPKPPRASYSINDKKLATLIENGVSTHHAGMDVNDRKLVEKLFLDGKISIICSTSTLAVGVNLPARMVIIRGTKAYIDGRTMDYADMDILQCLGRAGRPQFDRSGVALIMTDKESQQRYENLVNAQKNLESCLHKSLVEHINSEITLRTITDVDTALRWLRSTFLYVRISRNPAFYAIAKGTKLSPDARLEEMCVEAVKQLVNEGIVAENEDQSLAPNDYGEIMSKYYISHPTFVVLKSMPHGANMRSLLETISKAEEFSSFRIRAGEKSVLAKVNKMIRFPVEKVATTADRIMILLQVVFEGITGQEIRTENVNPLLEIGAIWPSAIRIAKAIFDLATLRKDGSARLAMELLRSLNGRCWDGSSFVLRQLKGIGEKGYKALVDAGIRSFVDVASAAPDRLEIILHRKPPFGSTLVDMAKAFPKFQIDLSIEHEQVRNEGVEVEVRVGISLEKTKPAAITKKGNINLNASLLLLTSDNHFIEYRRAPLAAIVKGSMKPFSVSIMLVKPSQRVVASVSCDLMAGSEVRAEVKPTTKASDFPIPSLASEPEESLDELRATSSSSKAVSRPFSAPKSTSQKRSANDDVAQAQSSEPRMRVNGKYECNHSCKDKGACKHLCCREGLDKPPRPSAASKKRKLSTTSRSNSLDTSTSTASKPQSRIPMKSSSGVTLAQDSSGKVIARTKSSSSNNVKSVSTSSKTTKPSAKQAANADDDDDDEDLPNLDEVVDSALVEKVASKKKQAKRVVFTEPSPTPPSSPRSRTASPDPFTSEDESSKSVQRKSIFDKKKPSFGKSTLALDKAAKVPLTEFDSDEEDELRLVSTKRNVEVKRKQEEEQDSLFREDPYQPVNDDTFSPIVDDGGLQDIGGVNDATWAEGGQFAGEMDREVEDEYDDLDWSTAVAVAESYEDAKVATEKNVGTRESAGVSEVLVEEEFRKEGTNENQKQIEENEVASGVGDDDDDDFDDWIANNIIIKD